MDVTAVALILLATAAISVTSPASGAEITIETETVFIDGRLVAGDYLAFAEKAPLLPPGTIINLNSAGGEARTAIEIGRMIRARKFITVAGPLCASGCALVWVAGIERAAYDDSRIGFHGAWQNKSGLIVSSADGNAAIGDYLSRLGYKSDAIHYMIKADPGWLDWLDFDTAQRLGIDVKRLDGRAVAKFPDLYKGAGCAMSELLPCKLPDALKNYRLMWR